MNFKPLILSLAFGMLLILEDFNDSSPFSLVIGNLDQIFGPRMWYPVEVIYPLASILVFLLFGITCRSIGRKEVGTSRGPKTSHGTIFALTAFALYIILLGLDDIDDIARVLNLHLIPVANYWFAMEPIYVIGSCILFFAFGKVLYEMDSVPVGSTAK